MSSGSGHQRPAPTARVPCLNRPYGAEHAASSSTTRPSAAGGSSSLLDEVAAFKAQMSMPEVLRAAKEELIHLELDLEFKNYEVKRCQALLESKTARTRKAMYEREKFKDECEELKKARRKDSLKIAELTERNEAAYAAFQVLKAKLSSVYELCERLIEETKLEKEALEWVPGRMVEIQEQMADSFSKLSARVTTQKSRIAELKEDLRDCREQLEQKSQLCEEAQYSKQVLTEQVQELQEQLEELKADNARCQSKVQFVAEEHSVVLEQKNDLERELREEKEEKELLVAHLRVLGRDLCGMSDFKDVSAVALVEAIRAAVGKLSEDYHSVREREGLAEDKAKSLSAEKDALATENAMLKGKLMDLGELKVAKQKLEIELSVQHKAVSDMRAGIRAKLSTLKGMVDKVKQQNAALSSFLADRFAVRANLLEHGNKFRAVKDCLSVVTPVVSQLIDAKAAQDSEVQRLSAGCTLREANNAALKAEINSLCEGITNFEQLAEASAEELEHAKAEIKSLKESLAEARAQVVPMEEREKAALLTLEQEARISQLEKDLKEMEQKVAQLIEEKAADANMAELMRGANEELKGEVLKLTGQLAQEQERRDSMVDCDVQTECLPQADRDVQTESNTMVDGNVQTECLPRADRDMQTESAVKTDQDMQTVASEKVDSEVQVSDSFDDAILAKLATSQLNEKQLSVSVRRLGFEKTALESSCKERESKLVDMKKVHSDLEKQVEELEKKVDEKEQQMEKLIKKINVLEAEAASQERTEQSSRASTATLMEENERLKAELSCLQERVRGLGGEKAEGAGASVKRRCYRAAGDKKAGAQRKTAPKPAFKPASKTAAPKPAPRWPETPELFTPDGSPISPGCSRPVATYVAKLVPLPTSLPAVASDEGSVDDSLEKLVKSIEERTSKLDQVAASSTPAGKGVLPAAGWGSCHVAVERVVLEEQAHTAKKPVEKRSKSKDKKAAAQASESSSAPKRPKEAAGEDATPSTSGATAAPPSEETDAPPLPSKKRKFFKSKDYEPSDLFKIDLF